MYTYTKTFPDTYRILDEENEAVYLILRSSCAYLIDTGMGRDSLKDFIASLTDLPVQVLLTHGHIDHIGRTGEFTDAALNPADQDIYRIHVEKASECGLPVLPYAGIRPLAASYEDLVPAALPGHTPGSTIFADTRNHAVYTGDALGSGCGVWMQIEGALSIREYRDGIRQAATALSSLHCDASWRFFGGHAGQELLSRVSSFNPLCLELMQDMEELCTRLLSGGCPMEKAEVRSDGIPYYASYGKAEILTTEDRCR